MPILVIQSDSGADDASENYASSFGSSFEGTKPYLKANSGSPNFMLGAFFDAVPIKGVDTITASVIRLAPDSLDNDDANENIYFEDVDSAVNFTTDPDVNGRVRTGTNVSWLITCT